MTEPTDMVLEILKGLQKQLTSMEKRDAQQTSLLLAQAEYLRRLDRRMAELPGDIEMMLKAELMGRATLLEDSLEARLQELAERITALEAGR